MASNKKGFLLYCDLIHTVKQLPDDKAGVLFKHILEYVNDCNPVSEDLIINLTFEPIKQQLKRDLKHWESIVEKRKIAGAKGAKQKLANASKDKQSLANVAVIDKDTVTVTDTVIVKDTNKTVLEVWFSDLENSSDLELIAMHNKMPVERIRSLLSDFKVKADLSYQNYQKFVNHFKNWVPKHLTNIAKDQPKKRHQYGV